MRKEKIVFLSEILAGRANLAELLVVAILIALGVNIIGGSLFSLIPYKPHIILLTGIVLCLICVLYLFFRFFGRRSRIQNFKGFFIYNAKQNQVIHVRRYDFSWNLSEYLRAAFFENEALKTIWDKEPLIDFKRLTDPRKPQMKKKLRSMELINEATEYYVLDELSTHLTDYFHDDKFKKDKLKEFRREDIPDVLLTNRFLELFSKSMEDRPHLIDHTFEKRHGGETTALYQINGARYERFDLVLPKESKVRRLEENKVEINTKKFIITITVCFEGSGAVLPPGFEEYYVFFDKFDNFKKIIEKLKTIKEFEVRIDIEVVFKFGALLSPTGWEYYRWVDSFLNKLDESISEDRFFETIGWNSAFTVIECITKAKEAKTKNDNKSAEKQ